MERRGALADKDEGKLELIARQNFPANTDLVKVVDFLNKSLKSKHVMFGVSKDREKDQMIISIYEV
ncbi:MAG TPA: YpmA family protein [Syntrophomonadaceae bacterium]|nr:YpmA family protein [Syntrophomonadaceae bacterium]